MSNKLHCKFCDYNVPTYQDIQGVIIEGWSLIAEHNRSEHIEEQIELERQAEDEYWASQWERHSVEFTLDNQIQKEFF